MKSLKGFLFGVFIMKNRLLKFFTVIIIVFAIFTMLGIGIVAIYYKRNVNTEYDDLLFENEIGASSTVFYANSSNEKNEYLPVRVDIEGSTKKIYYNLNEVSDLLKDGFIAVEDRGFYDHSGVDLKRTALAAINYLRGSKNTFGASTITQQLIKNISGDNEVSIRRKFTEILRAYNIEKKRTKSEILEVYLNIIPMGNGIFGVGAASEIYFNKSPDMLSVEEAATLIGITNAPTAYNPYTNPEKCIQKRNKILNVMYSEDVISDTEYYESIKQPLNVEPRDRGNIDSWFVETVTSDIVKDYAKEIKISESLSRILIMTGGYSIYTTMNTKIQGIMEEIFENENYLPKEVKDGLTFSMVVMDPANGDVLGIIGGAGKKSANRIINHATVPHTPASTLKPIALYAPLIDNGEINWSTVFDDVPVNFTESNGSYVEYPKNSPDRYDGLITVKDALKQSKNTVAMQLYKLRGANAVFDTLKSDYDFDRLVESKKGENGTLTDKAVAPLAFGQLTEGISLRKLTEAYTAFPNYGEKAYSRTYLYVTDKNGEVVIKNDIAKKTVFRVSTGKIMNQLLAEVVKDGTARTITLDKITSVAGKTGTSSNNRDKVFIGYTPSIVAGIWCGYDSGKSIGALSPTHLGIWDKVMTRIYENCFDGKNETFSTEGLIYAPYCMDSGKRYSHSCIYDPRGERLDYGYFLPDDERIAESCDTHIIVNYDTEGKGVVISPDPKKIYAKVSLIKNNSRSFPKEVFITDAEYVYRDVFGVREVYYDENLPYFYSTLNDGEYVGISNKKKQFNRLTPSEEFFE